MFPETDAKGCKIICERILFDFIGQRLGDTSLSIGITQYDRKWGLLSANLLVAKADEAMYMVKCKGGNGIHIYSQPLSEELAKRETVVSQDKLR
jgi:GGDEF domain-containing protein